ncbi:MAG: hypothetical protein K0R99_1299 [Microbacterium sp.]|nr:hypothetical protein [Microbacterium sp.]
MYSVPSLSSVTVKGPDPMISAALPAPKSSIVPSSVSGDSRPELMVEVACRKPGDGALKWNVTVSSSTTSLLA